MRAHPQNSDTAHKCLTDILQKKKISAKVPEKLGKCKENALTSSLNIPNALKQLILVMSVFRVEWDLDSGYPLTL